MKLDNELIYFQVDYIDQKYFSQIYINFSLQRSHLPTSFQIRPFGNELRKQQSHKKK